MMLPQMRGAAALWPTCSTSPPASTPQQSGGGANDVNSTANRTSVAVLQCPSDTDRLTTVEGHHNYAANSGSAGTAASAQSAFNGPYPGTQALGLRDIIDGTSNTAGFSERVKGIGQYNDNSGFDTLKPPSTFSKPGNINTGIPSTDYSNCYASAPVSGGTFGNWEASNTFWTTGNMVNGWYNHVMPPNTWSCATSNAYPARGVDGVEPALGVRQRRDVRRLGPLGQEFRLHSDLVGGRHDVQQRGRRQHHLLID